MTDDENTIFFASDFMSEGEDLDLFVAYKNEEGVWSEPEPLQIFNTEFDEDSPFLASDSTFYFSSRGHNSMGGYDIFKSTYDPVKKSWTKPQNLGFPINTVAEDTYFSTDGKIAYLSSTREGGYGSLDLYRVFLFNKVKVEGVLYNKDQKPMTDAQIIIHYDSITLNSFTDENGNYEMFVPVNKKMHIRFVKDSLDQFEGDYIANIFMKDENNNEFNFFIDYLSPESKNEEEAVSHINIEVKNDYKENPIIASTAAEEEVKWSDSVNTVVTKILHEKLEAKELTYLEEKEDKIEIKSQNLHIRDAVVERTEKSVVEEKTTDENPTVTQPSKNYTIQILAIKKKEKPDQMYFSELEPGSDIGSIMGKDGINRFYIGEYPSKKEALREMRSLREKGYSDAFIRKLSKYASL
jgi:hypothetical protein